MRFVAASALIAVVLAGCGSSSGPATTVSVGSSSSTSPTTPAASGPASSSSISNPSTGVRTGATTSSQAPLCRAPGLRLSFIGQQGATGRGELGFELTNATTRSCHTFGYPGIEFLGASGAPLPTTSTRVTHDFFGQVPEQGLIVGPGQSVSFRIGVTHGISSAAGCTTAAALQVIPPNDTQTLRVSIPQGAYECGKATLSPLRPGRSAYP